MVWSACQSSELGWKGDNTYICNPIIKEYMIVPKQHFGDVKFITDIKYGFGLSVAGEYKVIRLWSRSNPIKVEVYTLGTGQWNPLGQVPYFLGSVRDHHGLYLNCHVHWIVDDQILSFDLDKETFQLSPLPPLHEKIQFPFLGIFKGRLSLFSTSHHAFSIWVMKEHEFKKSWHKELEVNESIYNMCLGFQNWFSVSLVDGSNGKSIMMVRLQKDKNQLVAYCFETNTIEDTTISDNCFKTITYRPSFFKLQTFQSARVDVF